MLTETEVSEEIGMRTRSHEEECKTATEKGEEDEECKTTTDKGEDEVGEVE